MINRALRLLRTYHDLTQAALAKRLEISGSYLSEIESGTKQPSLEILDKYAAIFKIPVSSILLFSEHLADGKARSGRLRVTAADKILKLLEWLEVRDEIATSK